VLSDEIRTLALKKSDAGAIKKAAVRSGMRTLRLDGANTSFSDVGPLYVAALLVTLPLFIRLGLYRAVIRFMGIHAALTIGLGVGVSSASLAVLNGLIVEHPFSKVTLERCIIGALQVVADASVSLVDCIVDSGAPQNVA
jgi:FlaA1/EpsC-like NDP-sugar epimerase